MTTHGVPQPARRRFKRAVRKYRAARTDRSARKALRAIKGYLHHGALALLGAER